MSRLIDLTGRIFGKLTVICRAWNDSGNRAQWFCECACGEIAVVRSNLLVSGATNSCGCHMRTLAIKHGKYKDSLYNLYRNMIQRCYTKSNRIFKYYGGRGIKICPEWKDCFMNFYSWALNNGYSDGLTIDRIDNNGDYNPGNCRFVTHVKNCRNSSIAKRWIVNGDKYESISDASKKLGVCATTIRLWCDGGLNNGKLVSQKDNCYSYQVYN